MHVKKRINAPRLLLIATVTILLGCSSTEGPRPLSMQPSTGALGAAVVVRIMGEGFAPLVRANYDDEASSKISITFSAVLGGHPLQQVLFVNETELSAVVPAGLPVGMHSLSVKDPSGAHGTLANAFSVGGATPDGGLPEGGISDGGDGPVKTDGPIKTDAPIKPDTKPTPDTKPPPPDQGTGPLSTAQISAALAAVKVQCIDHNGNPQGGTIPILDSKTITLVNGSVTLSTAPSNTKSWVGSKPSVCVVWDLNACDREDPWSNDGDWSSAGLLIRGATLSKGKLVLQPATKTTDMDLINVNPSGTHQGSTDFVLPTDASLSSYPHLVNPVTAAKKTILSLK